MKKNTLYQTYAFPGFTPQKKLLGLDGNSDARIIVLKRHQKKHFVRSAVEDIERFTTAKANYCETYRAVICTSTCTWRYAG
jgi:hypothetical protein